MTSFPKWVWSQLKNKTIQDIASALERDGWEREIKSGATHPYRHPEGRRVVLHMHPKATKGPRTLKGLIDDIGWEKDDLNEITWTGDERRIYQSSPGIGRGFCGKCGTPLTWEGHVEELGGDLIEVFISTTDAPDALVPQFHIWTDERIEWFDTVDELPRYHGWMHDGSEPFNRGPVMKGKGPSV